MHRTGLVIVTAAVAILIGLGMARDGGAFYGDPRFFQSQPQGINRLLHNVPPTPEDDYLVSDYGANTTQQLQVAVAIGSWNSALQSAPNYLSKYALHFNTHNDPASNVNIRINFVDQATTNAYCKKPGDTYDPPACNFLTFPVSTMWISTGLSGAFTVQTLRHELGHNLWYDDQYLANSGDCSPGPDSIMNCATTITTTDLNDFLYHYDPAYQSADPTFPDTWNATWNIYYGGSVNFNTTGSNVEYKYYWNQWYDTTGSVQASYNSNQNAPSLQLAYVLGSRFCVTAYIYNEVGYASGTGGAAGPRSQFSCVGAAQVQNAGFLLSTSDRGSPSDGTLYVRIKNFSGGTRNVGIFGYPNFNNIGCGYENIGNQATRQCYVPLNRGAYDRLAWYAYDGSGNLSWGYLDFE